jgi:hypothetical protein
MADVKISQLPQASLPLTGTEVFPLVQNGVTVQAPVVTAGNIASINALRGTAPANNVVANVEGYYTPGDGGNGQFYAVTGAAAGTYVDNGGTIIVPTGGNGSSAWLRIYSGAVSVKWFGAKGDGITDDRLAIQAAFNTATSVYFPSTNNSYYITNSVNPRSNTEIFGDGSTSLIKLIDGSINGIYVVSVSNVTIRDISFTCESQTSSTVRRCPISVYTSTYINIFNVLINSFGYNGILFWDSSYCRAENCSINGCFDPLSGATGYVQDSADISVYGNSNYNTISTNKLTGGVNSENGVLIQGVGANVTPIGNKILDNDIDIHAARGVILYAQTIYDSKTLIQGNNIRNIQGTALSGQSGHGIYVLAAGGTIVTDNTLTNCCVQSTNFATLALGAIGISIGNPLANPGITDFYSVLCSNNYIVTEKGPGIAVKSSDAPVSLIGNTIKTTGTTAIQNECIQCVNTNSIKIHDNVLTQLNSNYFAINVTSSSSSAIINNASVEGNTVSSVASGILLSISSTGSFENCSVVGNTISGCSTGAISMQKINNLTFSANAIDCTGYAISVTNCPKASISGNTFKTTNAGNSYIFTGAAGGNNGMIVDASNTYSGGLFAHIAGTGGTIITYGASAPAYSGAWAVGDRVFSTTGTVGQPTGWICTINGTPGTWTALANL